MAVVDERENPIGSQVRVLHKRGIASVGHPAESKSLWADALSRLVRNRAAVAGAVILLLLVIMAVLAPVFAL